MKANLQEILKSLPDFEDFMNLADEIANLSYSKMQLENHIKARESETFRKAMATPDGNGKFPSAAYVNNAFVYTGIENELLPEREKLAYISSDLDRKKIQLSIYRDMLDVFRTVSANERNSSL